MMASPLSGQSQLPKNQSLCSKRMVTLPLCGTALCLYFMRGALSLHSFLWCFFGEEKKKVMSPPT